MIADIYLAISQSPYLVGVEQDIGAENLDVNAVAPRMVWVPTGVRFERGGGVRSASRDEPRTPVTRYQSVKIRVWGKSLDSDLPVDDIRAVENLINHLVVAINDGAHGSVTFEGGEWVEGGEIAQYGRAFDVNCTFMIPVIRDLRVDAQTSAEITTVNNADITGRMDFPPYSATVVGTEDGSGSPAP